MDARHGYYVRTKIPYAAKKHDSCSCTGPLRAAIIPIHKDAVRGGVVLNNIKISLLTFRTRVRCNFGEGQRRRRFVYVSTGRMTRPARPLRPPLASFQTPSFLHVLRRGMHPRAAIRTG
jgi:hypothetical protein